MADVQAIHPGYGFLSENPRFAEVCGDCNFTFIGPPHDAIRRMGLKTEAKAVARAANVPCVPGSDGPVDSDAEALRLARSMGFPVLIKAAAGGGGQGMRVVREESAFLASLQSARNEAEAAFKNASVYLEKFYRPAPARRGPDPRRHPRQGRPPGISDCSLQAAAPEARRGRPACRPCR